jgi:hypothetical protein
MVLNTARIVPMSHDELRTIPTHEIIDNDLKIIFEILGIYRDSKRRLKPIMGVYDSEDQFLKIYSVIEIKRINYPKQLLRITKDLLEEELAELTLYKDFVPDLAGVIVVVIGIFFLFYQTDVSGVAIDIITKRFPVLVTLAGALITLIKFCFNLFFNNKINRLKKCLMVVNQVIDKVELEFKTLTAETQVKTTARREALISPENKELIQKAADIEGHTLRECLKRSLKALIDKNL